MLENNLRSEYRKVAYLELIGVKPLVAVREPLSQRPSVRYKVGVGFSDAITSVELDVPRSVQTLRGEVALSSGERERELDQLVYMRTKLQEVSEAADVQMSELPESSKRSITEEPETSISLPESFFVLIYQCVGCVLIALEPTFEAIHMNLLRNVALACKAPNLAELSRPTPLELLEFRWPIANLDGSKGQADAAKYAMSGFLKRNLDEVSCFIFFGSLAQQVAEIYLADVESADVLLTDGLDELLQSPTKKQVLWTQMRNRGFA